MLTYTPSLMGMMTLDRISSALIGIVRGLVKLIGAAVRMLRQGGHHGCGLGSRRRFVPSDDWRRLQWCVSGLDVVLLLAVTPLFLLHAFGGEGAREGIWDIAFESPPSTFAMTLVMLIRAAAFAAFAARLYCNGRSRRLTQLGLLVGLALLVITVASVTAVSCWLLRPANSTCAAVRPIPYVVIAVQAALALLTTTALLLTTINLQSRSTGRPSAHLEASSVVTARAPSLSLLIHTQPSPWSRHIDLHIPTATEFGSPTATVPQHHPASTDYDHRMVTGVLDTTTGSGHTVNAATASLGYGSAVASSTNPYQVESNCSLTSGCALGGYARSNRIDVAESSGQMSSDFAESTSRTSAPGATDPTRTPSPGLFDVVSRSHSDLGRSVTEHNLIERQTRVDDNRFDLPPGDRVAVWTRLITCVVSVWCSIALWIAALTADVGKDQAHVLMAAFVAPASVLLFQELVLGCVKRGRSGLTARPNDRTHPRIAAGTDPASVRASTSSSIVVITGTPTSISARRPHLRSRSCPLESELNGYGDSLLECSERQEGTTAKRRQSLSSTNSVPYMRKHWAAGKVDGDRVVAPRSSFVRGLNLVLNPRPRLEVLPCQHQSQHCSYVEEESHRESPRPISVTAAVAQYLLQAPRHDHLIADADRTCMTQSLLQDRAQSTASNESRFMPEEDNDSIDMSILDSNRFRHTNDDRCTDLVLDMDDSPGGARHQSGLQPLGEISDLQSPTKRPPLTDHADRCTPVRSGGNKTESPSFSRQDSQEMGGSTSRLFCEIMDMVRGNAWDGRVGGHRDSLPFAHVLRRTPPKGYAGISCDAQLQEVGVSLPAGEDGETIIIRSMDSGDEYHTPETRGAAQTSMASLMLTTADHNGKAQENHAGRLSHNYGSDSDHVPRKVEHARTGSASSVLSLSSISSRIRALGRSPSMNASTPYASPKRGESPRVKRLRSRTFASAFGIELALLSRNGSRSRKLDSSPSTSSGGCPSSLMGFSFSPSPARACEAAELQGKQQETPSPLGHGGGGTAIKLHKRDYSRADSILDMLDVEHGDRIEQMLDPDSVDPVTLQVTVHSDAGNRLKDAAEHRVEMDPSVNGIGSEISDLCEVDLGDMTVNDVWGCFSQPDGQIETDSMSTSKFEHEEIDVLEEDIHDLMGGDPRRMVARAPFLDTVEEESEEGSAQEYRNNTQQRKPSPNPLDVRDGSREPKTPHPCEDVHERNLSYSMVSENRSISTADLESRNAVLLEQQAQQSRITKLLSEHEAMYPHKTLSRIEEVTEALSSLRASGMRTNSGGSNSRIDINKGASPMASASMHLGLPLSLSCQQDIDWRDGKRASVLMSEANAGEDVDQGERSADRQLPYVTPRSKTRSRAAAGRKGDYYGKVENIGDKGLARDHASFSPSTGPASAPLGQLGMDRGMCARSPLGQVQLDDSAVSQGEGSFETIQAPPRVHDGRFLRLKRSLTLTRGKKGPLEKNTTRKLVRLDHGDSPKREHRDRLAKASPSKPSKPYCSSLTSSNPFGGASEPFEKRLMHKPIKKRRKSRLKGVAVMISRHQFTVVDEDDSLIQRFSQSTHPYTCQSSM